MLGSRKGRDRASMEATVAVATLSYRSSGSVHACAHACVLCVLLCMHVALKLSRNLEPLSQFKATSLWEMPVKAQLQGSMISHCLHVEPHSLVLFLIDGFVFAMPGLKVCMNPTACLHAFTE